ncbi:MAG: hypothetical protein KF712_19425 [Akkermansiaceae bacterium]|nr:hypothetical protein [Akkermansiaceae bacterium]
MEKMHLRYLEKDSGQPVRPCRFASMVVRFSPFSSDMKVQQSETSSDALPGSLAESTLLPTGYVKVVVLFLEFI